VSEPRDAGDPLIGRVVAGRYEIVRSIGDGGMAEVFLARQLQPARRVALKRLRPGMAASPDVAARFLREAEIAGTLSHPNLITVHEYLVDDGTPFIAMEYLERGSLRSWVGRLTVTQAGAALDGVLAALDHAAEHGVVHRDLKPENLLLTAQGTVKVTDFGIAKALERTVTAHGTSPGMLVGTVEYMAPEQAKGEPVDTRTDLYAVGVVAYELLTGRLPFPMTAAGGVPQVLHAHVATVPASPRALVPSLDPRLDAWVMRLLEKDPARRPASARQARAELQDILEAVAGPRWRDRGEISAAGAQRTEIAPPPLAAPAAPPPPTAATRVAPPAGRRSPVLMALIGVGAVAVAVAGIAGAYVLTRDGGDADAAGVTTPSTTPVTAPSTTPATTAPRTPTAPVTGDLLTARELTNRAAELLNAGDPVTALQLQAGVLGVLRDSGDSSEGNAYYNAGRARLALAMCESAREDLQRSVDVGGLPAQMPIRERFLAQATACAEGRHDRTEPYFRSQTGNLVCDAATAGRLQCWRLQPSAAGFALDTGARPAESAPGGPPRGPRLAVQQTWGAGAFRCRLEEYGMACRDGAGGWGFFLSRQRLQELEPPTG